ncbi:MAG: hypothetical protein AAFQ95_05425 [Cyanobacteria bacterium J06621_3]
MTLRIQHWVAGLLGISGIALFTLVPGGPIETRSFAHINSITLGAFNTFLTTLVLGSLLLVYFVLRAHRWAMMGAAISGLSFLAVYGLDLVKIFPVSPDAMPPALFAVEVLGTILSFPLIALSVKALQAQGQDQLVTVPAIAADDNSTVQTPQILMVIALTVVALGIIAFATKSAMGL